MYAAMPAILKDACERAYIAAGWDLAESTNEYDNQPVSYTHLDVYKRQEHFSVPYKDRFQEGEMRKRIQFMYGGELQRIRFEYTGPVSYTHLMRRFFRIIIYNILLTLDAPGKASVHSIVLPTK